MDTSLSQSKHAHGARRSLAKAGRFLTRNLTNCANNDLYLAPIFTTFGVNKRLHGMLPVRLIKRVKRNNRLYTLTLKNISNTPFKFKPGQFINLQVEINGRRYQRCFSISSSPEQYAQNKQIDLTISSQHKGQVTPWINETLPLNSKLYISSAMGEFVVQAPEKTNVFIAAGSGISPILSMLKDLESKAKLKDSKLLFYFEDDAEEGFKSELEELARQGLNYSIIDPNTQGLFTIEHLTQLVKHPHDAHFYICGPSPMMNAVKAGLSTLSIEDESIFTEQFGPEKPAQGAIDFNDIAEQGNLVSDEPITVTLQRSAKQLSLDKNDTQSPTSLLDLIERRGVNAQSGCRIGVCHQCVCRKNSGRVLNLGTGEVSDSGAGQIQLCQSVALEDISIEL